MRRGQAMIETVLAVIAVTGILLLALRFSDMLAARIFLDHAAARGARARTVRFNNFMCLKSARAAMIPAAGARTWPTGTHGDETWLVPDYLASETAGHARGILDYARWDTTALTLGEDATTVRASLLMRTEDGWNMDGKAEIEAHAPFYMDFQGR